MIVSLHIQNFRSLREASLELGRFTVLTGANNSGKSSVLYALQVLRNVVRNPNRAVDELLNLGFLNLSGLEACIYNKNQQDSISLFINSTAPPSLQNYGLGISMGRQGSNLMANSSGGHVDYSMTLPVSFPTPLDKVYLMRDLDIVWNGIHAKPLSEKIKPIQMQVINGMNMPSTDIASTDVIPTHRGFSKPIFNQIPLNGTIQTEDEIATLLAIDKNLQAKVSHYFEKITGKRFSVLMGPGGGFFYLQVREPDSPFTTELVNQGMGVNQILFLLAKILYDKNRLIGIDEPEIHLHPSLMEKFISVLVEIAEKEDKQFIFSTHSEHWLMSLLAEVNDGHLAADDLKVYYLFREGPETKIEAQKVADNGQLEGGLRNFLEAEMRLTQRFLD